MWRGPVALLWALLSAGSCRGEDRLACPPLRRVTNQRAAGTIEVPASPVPGDHVRACGPRALPCCPRSVEAQLGPAARLDLQRLVEDSSLFPLSAFEAQHGKMDAYMSDLLRRAEASLHDMFMRSYGFVYTQNADLFLWLFEQLRQYAGVAPHGPSPGPARSRREREATGDRPASSPASSPASTAGSDARLDAGERRPSPAATRSGADAPFGTGDRPSSPASASSSSISYGARLETGERRSSPASAFVGDDARLETLARGRGGPPDGGGGAAAAAAAGEVGAGDAGATARRGDAGRRRADEGGGGGVAVELPAESLGSSASRRGSPPETSEGLSLGSTREASRGSPSGSPRKSSRETSMGSSLGSPRELTPSASASSSSPSSFSSPPSSPTATTTSSPRLTPLSLSSWLLRPAPPAVNLDEVMSEFWSQLLERMLQLLNPQYAFSDADLECALKLAERLQPFGAAPRKLLAQLGRAILAARSLAGGLRLAAGVANATRTVPLSAECVRSLARMWYCPQCEGGGGAAAATAAAVAPAPCHALCLNVLKGCLAHAADMDAAWNSLMDAMLQLTERLEGPFNVETVLAPIDVRISDAIMHLQENSVQVSTQIFAECGIPKPGRARQPGNAGAAAPPSGYGGQSRAAAAPSASPGNTLVRLVQETRDTLRRMKAFWASLPFSVCNTDRVAAHISNEDSCWNGDARGRYVHEVVGDGLAQQRHNPEVRVDVSRPDLQARRQIMALRVTTNQLRSAFHGHDTHFPDSSDDWGSGSGECGDELCPRLSLPAASLPPSPRGHANNSSSSPPRHPAAAASSACRLLVLSALAAALPRL